MLLTTKQTKAESIEKFAGKLKDLSEKFKSGNQKDTLIKDLFNNNLQESENQRGLLKKAAVPIQALRLAINLELR